MYVQLLEQPKLTRRGEGEKLLNTYSAENCTTRSPSFCTFLANVVCSSSFHVLLCSNWLLQISPRCHLNSPITLHNIFTREQENGIVENKLFSSLLSSSLFFIFLFCYTCLHGISFVTSPILLVG